ncbi:MAG: hypothetical protein MI924_08140 [Chloroflexales bacterium]|nr:hypothetical protein [Chloroflexales bacterium]
MRYHAEVIVHIKEHPACRDIKQIVTIHCQQPEIKQGCDLTLIVDQQITGKEVSVNEMLVAAIWLVKHRKEMLHFSRKSGRIAV